MNTVSLDNTVKYIQNMHMKDSQGKELEHGWLSCASVTCDNYCNLALVITQTHMVSLLGRHPG